MDLVHNLILVGSINGVSNTAQLTDNVLSNLFGIAVGKRPSDNGTQSLEIIMKPKYITHWKNAVVFKRMYVVLWLT